MTKYTAHKKQSRDPDFIGAEAAMKRAARSARETARKTGTAVVYIKNGKIIKEKPVNAHSGG